MHTPTNIFAQSRPTHCKATYLEKEATNQDGNPNYNYFENLCDPKIVVKRFMFHK